MRTALIIAAFVAFASLSPVAAKPAGQTSDVRQDASRSGLVQGKPARKQRARKAAEYEPFCVRPFEYPRKAR
ncbi:MAG: hypothetical protein ACTSYK_07945 [Alphaproteobacteria bacterium]